jgi:hypothetical protein
MTERMFGLAEEPGEGDSAAEELAAAGESQSRRTMFAVGGALVVVMAAAVYFLFFAGGSDAPTSTAEPEVSAPAATPTPTPTTVQRVKSLPGRAGRDPFEPLIVAPVDAAVVPQVAGAPVTTAGSSDPAAGDGTDAAAGDGTDAASLPDTGGGDPTVAATHAPATAPSATPRHIFQVVSVTGDNKRVTVRVDGKSYKSLRAGQVFAKIFKVRMLGGAVNQFQIGDEPFEVRGTKAITIAG